MKTTKTKPDAQLKADQKKLGELWIKYTEGSEKEQDEFYTFKEKMLRKYKNSYYESRCKGNLKLVLK